MTDFDKTVRPQDDFFGYVNNNWIKKNPIPDDQSGWGIYQILNEESTKSLKSIINELLKTSDSSLSHSQKLLKPFYITANNYTAFKDNHLKTVKAQVDIIDNIKSKSDLFGYLGSAHRQYFSQFWSFYVDSDDKNAKSHVLRIQQGGLSLPNRDYYIENNLKMKNIRKQFKNYYLSVIDYFDNSYALEWKNIINIETELAKLSWTEIRLRNIEARYNKFSIASLQKRFPEIDWGQYFKGLGWAKPTDNVVVDEISFIEGVAKIIESYSLDQIKDYLKWNILCWLIKWVDEKGAIVNFNFMSKEILGRKAITPLWKRMIFLADNFQFGELLGKEYATRFFPESSKMLVKNIVEDIRTAYHIHIDQAQWMMPKTKMRAHKKLDNIRVFIGYPPTWHDFSKIDFTEDNLIENLFRANQFDTDFELAKIGKPPESEDWHMFAHDVNAYHDLNQLVVCFSAAILQPPCFDPKADYATNLGGIGSIIGHEFTHAFDDNGSQFNEFGNAEKWISTQEIKKFNAIAKKLVNQANKFEVLPNVFLKGKLILGEAIADIGGLELAVEALKAKNDTKNINKNLKKLYINNAIWERESKRDEYILMVTKTDPHPVSQFRINGTIIHTNGFYDAFNVKPGDKLYLPPEERVHIW